MKDLHLMGNVHFITGMEFQVIGLVSLKEARPNLWQIFRRQNDWGMKVEEHNMFLPPTSKASWWIFSEEKPLILSMGMKQVKRKGIVVE